MCAESTLRREVGMRKNGNAAKGLLALRHRMSNQQFPCKSG